MGDLNFGWTKDATVAERLIRKATRDIETSALDDRSGAAWRENLVREASRNCDERFPILYRDAVASHPFVAAWVKRFESMGPQNVPWLVMAGPVGTGKTYQAYGAIREIATRPVKTKANHYRNISWRAMSYIEFKASVSPSRGGDHEAEFLKIANTELLFIDDLATGKDTEWSEQQLTRLINHRYNNLKPTIITTNSNGKQLEAAVGAQVWSRIEQRCQKVVAITGDDRRRVRAA